MQKIYITGARGFIGQHLLKNIVDVAEVRGVSRTASAGGNIVSYNDFYADKDFDVVIHLAGISSDEIVGEGGYLYNQVNTQLAQSVFDHFKNSGAKAFVFFSSIKAVTEYWSQPVTEICKPHPQTKYGLSKLRAEAYINNQDLHAGKYVYVLRPSLIYGNGHKDSLYQLYQWIRRGLPFPFGAFSGKRSYLSINNLTFIIKQLLNLEIPAGTYHIADDQVFSTNEVVQLLADALNKKARVWNIPRYLITTSVSLGDLCGLGFGRNKLNKLTRDLVNDNNKLKTALGINYLPFNAVEEMKRNFELFGRI